MFRQPRTDAPGKAAIIAEIEIRTTVRQAGIEQRERKALKRSGSADGRIASLNERVDGVRVFEAARGNFDPRGVFSALQRHARPALLG